MIEIINTIVLKILRRRVAYKYRMGLFFFFLFFILILPACKLKPKDKPLTDTQDLNQFILQVMKTETWYLWYDKISDLDPLQYDDSYKYLEDLKYKELDKWSFLITQQEYDNYFNSGTYYGHGFAYQLIDDSKIFVTYVFVNSPMDRAGVTRGWELLSVNGITISQIISQNLSSEQVFGPNQQGYINHLKMVNLKQDTINFDVAKEEVQQNTVLYKNVYMLDNGKVGYLVFKSFIQPSFGELKEAFSYFESQGINSLVLDMRYNGGGMVSVSQYLASLIGGNTTNGQVYVHLKTNSTKTANDTTYFFTDELHHLNLNQVVYIATKSTASASEAVMNGLNPYMKSVIVGDDTHGKPVGMFSFAHNGFILVPICFKLTNSVGYGDYFDGLKADAYRMDDIYHDWGDTAEICLKESLYYIQNGHFSNSPATKSFHREKDIMQLHGFQKEIGGI